MLLGVKDFQCHYICHTLTLDTHTKKNERDNNTAGTKNTHITHNGLVKKSHVNMVFICVAVKGQVCECSIQIDSLLFLLFDDCINNNSSSEHPLKIKRLTNGKQF